MAFQTNSKIVKWIDRRLPIFSMMHHELYEYQVPKNLNWWYTFGSLAGIILMLQIITGVVLVMHYTPNTELAFDSVEKIMRDVNYGWLMRYMHANGASMFFIAVYIHIFRGLYYGSYKQPRELIWMIGLVILLLMMATAFMGYVLPWGQMSFWGATVITNLFSAFPVIGEALVTWLWGGFTVGNPTLNRFFSLHYLLPFVILGAVVVHLWALHTSGSNNPAGVEIKGKKDWIPFQPYYTAKDMLGFAVFALVFSIFIFYSPDFFGEPDNYIPANPLKTPPHIVPEWYFLPFYAILRAVPDKLGGVLLMFGAILVLFVIPWLDTSKVRSARFRPVYKWWFWVLVFDCLVLGYVGSQPPEGALILIGRLATAYYFLHFLVIMPLVGWFEKPLPVPASIHDAVLADKKAKESADA